MLDWLLTPGIPWLLQSATIAQTDRQVDTWLHSACSPLLIEGKRRVSLVRGVAGRAVDRRSLVLPIAAIRILLGLHFPSDCVAAVLQALRWLAICQAAAHPARAFTYGVGKGP